MVPVRKPSPDSAIPATVIIALVLIVSRGCPTPARSICCAPYRATPRKLRAHIAIMAGFAAALSAVMNNVAALTLLMPVDLKAAAKAKRSPALTLMPLSFASILGGMITLIGTPPNIVIAAFREQALGESYACSISRRWVWPAPRRSGAFIATVGWRLIPDAASRKDRQRDLVASESYVAELQVPRDRQPSADAS